MQDGSQIRVCERENWGLMVEFGDFCRFKDDQIRVRAQHLSDSTPTFNKSTKKFQNKIANQHVRVCIFNIIS